MLDNIIIGAVLGYIVFCVVVSLYYMFRPKRPGETTGWASGFDDDIETDIFGCDSDGSD